MSYMWHLGAQTALARVCCATHRRCGFFLKCKLAPAAVISRPFRLSAHILPQGAVLYDVRISSQFLIAGCFANLVLRSYFLSIVNSPCQLNTA
jgi:hypothetical protein